MYENGNFVVDFTEASFGNTLPVNSIQCSTYSSLFQLTLHHTVGHPCCVFINYIWLNQLSNTTNLWWIDVYYIVINYMFRRLWPSSG